MNYDYSMLVFPVAARKVTDWYRQREVKKEQHLLKELQALDKTCPYPLRWRRKNGRVFFTEWTGERQKSITSDSSRVYALARHDYLTLYLSDLRHSDEALWQEKISLLLQSFEEIGLNTRRIILTPKQYKWASRPQSQNRRYREELKYKTNNGVLVRSKSEQFIGNIFEEYGIPYRYEPELRIDHLVLHPDFVIMTTDGRLIIIEHLGRMDLGTYVKSTIDRLRAYNNENLHIGRDVFLTFESDIESREHIIDILYRVMAS